MMGNIDDSRFEWVSIVFEMRADGGMRVSSPDVPGFRLSHDKPEMVIADVLPALELIIGAIIGKPVRVKLASE